MLASSYSRRSDSKGKRLDERSVEEQDALSQGVAQRNGWDLPPTRMYRDNDLSASRYSTKERPDWERLKKELDSGEVEVLILWETSRAWRKLSEWVLLVDMCRDNKVLMHITSHHHTYDPTKRRDRKTLIEEGVDSEDETEKTSERVKRAMDANKRQGKPHARPPYGYVTQIDPNNLLGKIRVVQPEHAAIVEEVITRVTQSEPIVTIVKNLEDRGIPSPSVAQGLYTDPRSKGAPKWSPSMIRRLCTNVAYIGKSEYEGELVDAQWEAIVDPELFWKANNLLKDPKRKTTIPGKVKHLLAYLATCDVCTAGLCRQGGRSDPEFYKCSGDKACVTIRMDWVDLFISERACNRLARKDIYELLNKRSDEDKDLRTQLEKLRAEHQEALDLRASGGLSLKALSNEEARILPLITELEAALRPVSIPRAVEDLTRGAQGNLQTIRERWAALPMPAKRDVLRTLFKSISIKKAQRKTQFKTSPEQVTQILRERVAYEWANS